MVKNKSKLRSWHIVDKENGQLQMVLIVSKDYTQKDLNNLIQNGMKCVVIDKHSELVNKNFVDVDTV